MTYTKLDDLYDDKRKMRRAWRAHPPNPVGLHIMAITHCVRHRLDGMVPDDWIEEMLPKPRERNAVLTTMVREGLFDDEPHDDGRFRVHDFLDWNESAAERTARSNAARNAARIRHGGANGTAGRTANRFAKGTAPPTPTPTPTPTKAKA